MVWKKQQSLRAQGHSVHVITQQTTPLQYLQMDDGRALVLAIVRLLAAGDTQGPMLALQLAQAFFAD